MAGTIVRYLRGLPGAASVGVAAAVLAALLVTSTPAEAVIGGQDDAGGHPYVGGIDTRPLGSPLTTASGVLISPTVFLTAGHGTRFFERAGLTRARVTFDPVASDSSTWHEGTVHTNPAYDPMNTMDPGDLGVIVFDEPVAGVTPASLPTERALERLGLRHFDFNVVGYGVSRYVGGSDGAGTPRPDWSSAGTRKVAQQAFASLGSAWLRLRMDAGAEICIGDSGAPSLLGGSNVVAGITVGAPSLSGGQCESEPWDMRVDTPAARRFLRDYVTLP